MTPSTGGIGTLPQASVGGVMSIQQVSAPPVAFPQEEPLLSLELSERGTVTVIKVCGELDMSTAALLTDLVEAVVESRPILVIVDMAGVTFLCAAGVRGLIQARDMIVARGGRLVLHAPSRTARWVLTLTGTEDLFPLVGDETW